MAKLKYTLKNDLLFKMMFVKYPALLKRLVSELLSIPLESIGEFIITNAEMPPEAMGDKFCRLDINMTVDGRRVDLEIQVDDEGDYPERSLYYWAREFSTALKEREKYIDLPQTIIISIVAFEMFDCEEFYSEYEVLEVTRKTRLTDKFNMRFFELPKLPESVSKDDELKLWLLLFRAETEEELKKIESLEVAVMKEAIGAYRHVSATPEFRELERLRSRARHNEASALHNAELRGEKRGADAEREKWQSLVEDKDALIAELLARLGENK